MKLRLSLVAALALLAGACSHHDQPVPAGRSTGAVASASRVMSPGASARFATVRGYQNRFGSAADHGALVVYPKSPVVRRDGAYTSYLTSISEAHARDAIGGVLTVPLPSGEQLRFRYERHVEHPSGDWTWIGEAIGAKGQQAIITFGDKAAFGTIGQAGEQPWRLTVQNGASWLIRTDASQIAQINNSATRPTSPDYIVPPAQIAGVGHRTASSSAMTAASATTAAATTGTASNTVDLVIGYTPGFVTYYGGDSQAQTRLNNMVDITNQAYVNSGVDARVRLVKAMQVSYADNTSNDSALEALTGFQAPSTRTTPDPAFSALRAARDQYGADLVSLVRRFQEPENAGCGIAWLIGGGQSTIDSSDEFFGYSVVSDGKDAGTDGKTYYCREETLAHELGHNMGAQHDRATAQGSDGTLSSDEYGRYPYSFGYKTTSTAGNFYTIMAYGDSGQTSYRIFSDPRSTFCGGLACGVDNQTDNARTLSQTIPLIATFRATVVPLANRVADDINGDGKSDLVWRQLAQNQIAYWFMNGATMASYGSGAGPAGYRIIGIGDFNGDTRNDLLWDNGGTLLMWTSTGTSFTAAQVASYGDGWRPVTVADINGDGKSDIVWHRSQSSELAFWLMNGSSVASYGSQAAPPNYSVIGAGDFNGDGKLDLLWDNGGTVYLWTSTGSGFTSSLVASYGDGWQPQAAADVDGDGNMDIIWRQLSTNQIAYWYMNGASVKSYGFQPGLAGYSIIGTGDFNGDGRFDLVWDNGGTVYFWFSTGAGFTSSLVASYGDGWSPWANALRRR